MRLRTLAAIGIGYVLGRRAGEKRYRDMQRLVNDVVASDAFQQVVKRGMESLGGRVRMVTGTTPTWAAKKAEEAPAEVAEEAPAAETPAEDEAEEASASGREETDEAETQQEHTGDRESDEAEDAQSEDSED